jgi:hypothetical protein
MQTTIDDTKKVRTTIGYGSQGDFTFGGDGVSSNFGERLLSLLNTHLQHTIEYQAS